MGLHNVYVLVCVCVCVSKLISAVGVERGINRRCGCISAALTAFEKNLLVTAWSEAAEAHRADS